MSYILLVSAKNDQAATRTFREFESKEELSRAIISHFESWKEEEERMSRDRAGLPPVEEELCLEYTSDELWSFMDQFYGEMVCLVKEDETIGDLWVPQTIEWIKETIQIYLRSQYSKKLGFEDMMTDSHMDVAQMNGCV